jgi:hypothetical protein
MAMLAVRILKAAFFLFGCLFGILLASTLNTAFLHQTVSSITGQNNVGYIIMAMFALFFGIVFYCFEETVIVAATSFVGAYLLFYGIGYFAGNFPDTFNIGQDSSHQYVGEVPTVWYLYFAAIILWTCIGMHVQYNHTSKRKKKEEKAPPHQGNGYVQM